LRAVAFISLLTLFVASAPAQRSEDEERRLIVGLCDRQLYDLAQQYCRQRLADDQLAARWQSFYAIELSGVLVRQALAAPSHEAPALWEQALAAVEHDTAAPPAANNLLAHAQAGLVLLAQGQQQAHQAALSRDERDRALACLRQAIQRFDEVVRFASAPSRKRSATDAQRQAERSLANQVRGRQAEALRSLALLYAPETPDRADALNRALALVEPLADLPDDQPLAWESRLNLIDLLRLQGNTATAVQKLQSFEKLAAPVDVRLRLRAHAIQLALADHQFTAALNLARQEPRLEGRASPDLDYVRLLAILANAAEADRRGNQADAGELQREAQNLVAEIRNSHGTAWAARAEEQLANSVANAFSGSLSLWEQAAQTHYRAGQIDEAITAYERASQQAVTNGDADKAFKMAFLAATLEHQRKNYGEAAGRYRELALRWPRSPRAPEAHLLAAHDRWELLKASREVAPYVELLREHLRTWPQSESANEARWRLGRAAELAADWSAAVDAYRSVDPTHPRGADSVASLVRAYEQMLSTADERHSERIAIVAEGARYLENMTKSPAVQPLPAVRHQAAIGAARLWSQIPDGASSATRVLQAYLADEQLAGPDRQQAEDELLVCALGQLNTTESERQIARIVALDPDQLYRSLQTLARSRPPDNDAAARWIDQVISRVIGQAQSTLARLPTDRARDVGRWQAQSLARLGQSDQARELYDRLLQQFPGDQQLLFGAALLASDIDAPDQRDRTFQLWRAVERAAAKGSPDWLEARYQIARLHHLSGNDEQARRILRQTRLLHPELGGESLAARFAQLERALSPGAPR
jgi:tetratricopeptide (TPR) repeat protein